MMCVCIYIYIYTYMSASVYVPYTYTYTHTYIYTRTQEHKHDTHRRFAFEYRPKGPSEKPYRYGVNSVGESRMIWGKTQVSVLHVDA